MEKGLVLVVEDDPDIVEILEAYLARDGYRTVHANDGETGLAHVATLSPDLALLDIRLPRLDGLDLLTRIRRETDTAVILVTALAEDIDRLSGLRLGADDYIVKPFNPHEVVARVNAVLRRKRPAAEAAVLRYDSLEVDVRAYSAAVVTSEMRARLTLTLSEFRLLAHMVRRPAHTFTRGDLIDACLPDSDALERTVDTHIAHLRRKLEAAGARDYLTTVRGVGYRLAPAR